MWDYPLWYEYDSCTLPPACICRISYVTHLRGSMSLTDRDSGLSDTVLNGFRSARTLGTLLARFTSHARIPDHPPSTHRSGRDWGDRAAGIYPTYKIVGGLLGGKADYDIRNMSYVWCFLHLFKVSCPDLLMC